MSAYTHSPPHTVEPLPLSIHYRGVMTSYKVVESVKIVQINYVSEDSSQPSVTKTQSPAFVSAFYLLNFLYSIASELEMLPTALFKHLLKRPNGLVVQTDFVYTLPVRRCL